jgi:uncharacterized BrkB/YihY/UPF0761 family membrane protein
MLWLYITGIAILIGGEVNWVIEDRTEELHYLKRNSEPSNTQ